MNKRISVKAKDKVITASFVVCLLSLVAAFISAYEGVSNGWSLTIAVIGVIQFVLVGLITTDNSTLPEEIRKQISQNRSAN
jgi:membrane protein YdbS with pleckstrin-like domain